MGGDFCGDAMWWETLVVFFLCLEFSRGLLFLPVCGFALLVFVGNMYPCFFIFAFGPFYLW
jgi:hypothetical protein